jgi:hypothetical protein
MQLSFTVLLGLFITAGTGNVLGMFFSAAWL